MTARPAAPPWRVDLLAAAATAAVASTVLAAYYRLWSNHPGISWHYEGDGLVGESIIGNVLAGHWYYDNPRLGFPYGAHLGAYPLADHLTLAMAKVLGWVTGAPAPAVTNLLLFASFPLAAVTAFLALRWLGVSRPAAGVLGVLYAFTPYHVEREAGHLFLSMYFLVPLALAVLVRQLTGPAAFVDPEGGRLRIRGSGPHAWAALAVALLLPLTGFYYAVFFAMLGAGVVLVQLALEPRGRVRAAVASTVGLVAVAGASLVLALVPAALAGGSAGDVVQRPYYHAEAFGLRIDRLLLPSADHRIDPLGSFVRRIEDSSPVGGPDATSALGIVAAVGLVLLVAAFARRALGRRDDGETATPVDGATDLVGALGALALLAIGIGTVAGVGAILNAAGFAQIRGWNRLSIVVAFVALAFVGVLLDRAAPRLAGNGLRAGAAAVLLVAGLGDEIAPFDQATRDHFVAEWTRDEAFWSTVEGSLAPGSPVLVLPYMAFPESEGVADLEDSHLLRGSLHTDTLRFSYGGSRADVPAWDDALFHRPAREIVAGAVLAGFDAIHVDRGGFDDGGAAIAGELGAVLGPPGLVSDDGALLLWDIRVLRAGLDELDPADRAQAASEVVQEISVATGPEVAPEEGAPDARFRWLIGPTTTLRVDNRTDETRTVTLTLRVASISPGTMTLATPTGDMTIDVEPGRPRRTELELDVAPGRVEIPLRTDVEPTADDPRPITLQLFETSVDVPGGLSLASVADAIGLP